MLADAFWVYPAFTIKMHQAFQLQPSGDDTAHVGEGPQGYAYDDPEQWVAEVVMVELHAYETIRKPQGGG
jgi:hypothetical protein